MPEGQLASICVFCGSKPGSDPAYAADAVTLGRALAARGARLVYGGAQVGIMGTLADAVLGAGGEVVGVIPVRMVENEVAHEGLTRLHVVGSMHERKALMAELAEGFVAMPGGLGTLEELAEILTWSQLRLHTKPVGLLDPHGYFGHLLRFLDHAVDEEFVRPEHRALILSGGDAVSLLDTMERWAAERAATEKTGPGRRDPLWAT